MELYESISRKYKKGKTYQWSVPLLKGHPFEDKQNVVVGKHEDFQQLEENITKLEDEKTTLENTNQLLNIETKDYLKKITVATDIINKQKDIINFQDTIIAIYMNRGTLSRLRNKQPKEVKQLEENKQKLVELEDSRPLIIELSKGKEDKID